MVLKSVSLVVANRPDVVVEIPRPDDLNKLPDQPFTIKEGGEYRIKFAFQVRQDTVQHLKYSQSVKRQGYEVEHSQDEMVREPSTAPLIFTQCVLEDPLLTRLQGTYKPNTDSNPLYEKICKCSITGCSSLTDTAFS